MRKRTQGRRHDLSDAESDEEIDRVLVNAQQRRGPSEQEERQPRGEERSSLEQRFEHLRREYDVRMTSG